MPNAYDTLMQDADYHEAQARLKRSQAEEAHKKGRAKSLRAWVGYHFESSSSLTPEFAEFAAQARRELKKISNFELVAFSRGHFEFSAFLRSKSTGKMVYLSTSDVRFFPDAWWNDLLIRTAQHEKDYTGGQNNSCRFDTIGIAAARLTQ